MRSELSANAQAILLLTAPLLAGGRGRSSRRGFGKTSDNPRPLSTAQYRDFAERLRAIDREPGDLLGGDASDTLRDALGPLEGDRVQRLLGRGFLLAQAVERWGTRALWVVTRADPDYPRRLKTRMRGNAPPVLYGCGDRAILNGGGLAVVGSRKVGEDLIEYAEAVGRLGAEANTTIISGGARGVDQATMRGALEAGGQSVGILANGLERAALNRSHRNALLDGQLALVSPYDPVARFVVGHAMQRNKLIYALSDAALVVNSDYGHGGTWSGAIDQLAKLGFVQVYVRADGGRSKGLEGLLDQGAAPWPNPRTADELQRFVLGQGSRDRATAAAPSPGPGQYKLPLREATKAREEDAKQRSEEARPHLPASPAAPAERLLSAMSGEMSRAQLLTALGLKNLGNLRKRYLKPCLHAGWIEMTIPEKPSSVKQRFWLTPSGRDHLKDLRPGVENDQGRLARP